MHHIEFIYFFILDVGGMPISKTFTKRYNNNILLFTIKVHTIMVVPCYAACLEHEMNEIFGMKKKLIFDYA